MRIYFTERGDWNKTKKFFKSKKRISDSTLTRYGQMGVSALQSATPIDTGKTADAWGYEIVRTNSSASLYFINNNVNDGVNIAIILHYGHGTGTGGYVLGRDYINSAVQPIFDKLANSIWEEVKRHE